MDNETTPSSSAPSPKPKPRPDRPALESPEAALTRGLEEITEAPRLRTMWPRMERLCSPRRGHFWVIGGNPGNYKTALTWNLALDLADRGHRVLYVSLEQSTGQLAVNAAARYSRISRDRIELHASGAVPLQGEDLDRFTDARERLRALQLRMRLHGVEQHGRSLAAVLQSAQAASFDAVLGDHLGMIGRDDGRELDLLPEVVDSLRALARGELRRGYRPFVCVTSPLNRANQRDEATDESERLPAMSDFYGSRRIESDADTAIVVRKRKRAASDEESDAPDTVDAFVLKQRWGRCPLVLVFEAQGAIAHVVERHRSDTNPPAHHWQDHEPGSDG